MKISELTSNMNINMLLLVTAVKEGVTSASVPYLSITFRDNSGTIDGKLWTVREEHQAICKTGKVLRVKGDVINYRNALQLKVIDLVEPAESEVKMEDFVLTGPVPIDTLRTAISNAISSINNQDVYRIVSDIYRTYDKEIFASAAAAKNHHEYYGGLATHVYGMLKLADMVCMNYPLINRDLLVAGVLLHDIGKIIELSSANAVTEYTLEGKLIGHISISQTIIKETADKLAITGEIVVLLRHMVLSHHGQYEYGSPVLPLTIEAEALHFIDDFDAKMTMVEKELRGVAPKEFANRSYGLENRSFYNHEIK